MATKYGPFQHSFLHVSQRKKHETDGVKDQDSGLPVSSHNKPSAGSNHVLEQAVSGAEGKVIVVWKVVSSL